MKLTISKIAKSGPYAFEVDDKKRPGSPPVGRGATMMEAIGNYFHVNQSELGIEFELDPSAVEAEMDRRRTELAKR